MLSTSLLEFTASITSIAASLFHAVLTVLQSLLNLVLNLVQNVIALAQSLIKLALALFQDVLGFVTGKVTFCLAASLYNNLSFPANFLVIVVLGGVLVLYLYRQRRQ
jgi:uncharacterized membrane protein